MAVSIQTLVKIKDLVKVDGDLTGHVISITRPQNMCNRYVVQTKIGKLQMLRFRLRVIPETGQWSPHTNSAFDILDKVTLRKNKNKQKIGLMRLISLFL